MVGVEGIADWIGRDVVDRDGEKVGKLEDVYYDTADSDPAFVSVKMGTFGRSHPLAPLRGATLSRDYVRLAAPKELVKDAPEDISGGRLTGVDAVAVLKHFGLPPDDDLEGEDRVCFQTTGAAAETERKRAELEAANAREAAAPDPEPAAAEDDAPTGSVVVGAAPEPDRDVVDPERTVAPASARASAPVAAPYDDEDDPLRRLEQLERRVAALEARLG